MLKLIEMSSAGTLAIKKARPEDKGNGHSLYKRQVNPPLVYQVEAGHPITVYDPQSGTFVHMEPTLKNDG